MRVVTILSKRSERRGIGLIIIALLALFFLPASARAQTWTWTHETVDTSGKYTSLAVDQDGNLHVSYMHDQQGVKYAFRPAGTSRWFTQSLDGVGGIPNVSTRIALDAQGNPHICYTPETMKYAFWDGKKWTIQQIAPGSGTIEFNCSVAVDSDGNPHVTWYQYGAPDGSEFVHVRYATRRDGVWLARTVDFDMQAGKWHSMLLDLQGNPHVSFDSFIKGMLKYAYWNGKSWKVEVVDSRSFNNGGTYSRGMGNYLALTRDGKAQISYQDEKSLRYARRRENGWSIETVDAVSPSGSWAGYRTGQILDRQGFPHITYEDLGTLKHAYWTGREWKIQVILSSGPEVYRYSAIGIDRDDVLYVSYRDPFDGSLKVAVGRASKESKTVAGKEPAQN